MTECICGYRKGPTKIAYMLHLRLSYLWFWSGTVWRRRNRRTEEEEDLHGGEEEGRGEGWEG